MSLDRPGPWRLLSWLTLIAFAVSWLLDGPIPAWGWWALIASGVTFAIELALVARRRRATRPPAAR